MVKYEAIATIYNGAILPLLIYEAPVWIETMNFEHNRQKYIRVKRLINIRKTKAYRNTSSEELCMFTAMTPILIKLEQETAQYKIKQNSGNCEIEWNCEVETSIQVYTFGEKQEQGIGTVAVIFKGSEMIAKSQYKLDNRCSLIRQNNLPYSKH